MVDRQEVERPARADREGGGVMSEVPFVAIGNDELGEPVGDTVTCRTCGEQHAVEYGTSRRLRDDGTWSEPEPSKVMGFYRCAGGLYVASIDGRATP